MSVSQGHSEISGTSSGPVEILRIQPCRQGSRIPLSRLQVSRDLQSDLCTASHAFSLLRAELCHSGECKEVAAPAPPSLAWESP